MTDRAAAVLGFVGAPVAWVLHLSASYFLVALGCTTGWGGARCGILLATLVLGAVAAGAGWLGWRRRVPDPAGVRDFLGHGGAALAALFAVAIVFEGLPPLFLPLCGFHVE
jgi:hypothetical protein